MKNLLPIIGSLLIAMLISGCINQSRKAENVRTFAKVYGYVRWFYPGDEAAQTDWNKFAVYGIQKVENARNEKELQKILIELFLPVAPAIQIVNANMSNSFDIHSIIPKDTSGLNSVSWKHFGVFLGDRSNIYKSVRINRDSLKKFESCFVRYITDFSQYQGKEVKVLFSAKSIDRSNGNAYLFLDSKGKLGLSMDREPTTIKPDTSWNEYSGNLIVGKDDSVLSYGIGIEKSVCLLVSDFRVMVKVGSSWVPVQLNNANFEQELAGWNADNLYFDVMVDSVRSKNGNRCLKLSYTNNIPKIGEFINKNIGNHLTLLMPLALYKSDEHIFHLTHLMPMALYKSDKHTFPVSDFSQLNRLQEQLNAIPDSSLNTKNPAVRLANVVIAWNVLQHFFPYFDVVHTDWDKELTKALNELYSEKTEIEYYKSLMRMTAKLDDAHVDISGSIPVAKGLSIKVELFDQDIVVTASSSNMIRKGDIIKNIDGKRALTEFHEIESQISGTPNLKRNRALWYFGTDFSKPEAKVTLIRDGKEIRVTAQRFPNHLQFVFNQGNNLPGMIDCGDGIFYLKGNIQDINSLLSTLVNAKGIIVGSSHQLWQLLPHMIREPVWCARWNIPINTYPDGQKTYWNKSSRWTIEPKLPFLKAKFAVITSSDDQSSLETALGIFDHYKMGFTVGDTTAGCNGNVNYTPLIGNSTIRWTGMKVLKHDYSQHHLIGFNPDYPVVRTKEAVLQGRDEYLEKAKEILKKNIGPPVSIAKN